MSTLRIRTTRRWQRSRGHRFAPLAVTDDFRIADFPSLYEGKLFFLTTPNSPLGFSFPPEYITELAGRCGGMLVVDERMPISAVQTRWNWSVPVKT